MPCTLRKSKLLTKKIIWVPGSVNSSKTSSSSNQVQKGSIDFNLNSNHVIKCPASYCEKLSSHLDSVIDYSNVLLNEDSSSFE